MIILQNTLPIYPNVNNYEAKLFHLRVSCTTFSHICDIVWWFLTISDKIFNIDLSITLTSIINRTMTIMMVITAGLLRVRFLNYRNL